jgi:hypothetical protein
MKAVIFAFLAGQLVMIIAYEKLVPWLAKKLAEKYPPRKAVRDE